MNLDRNELHSIFSNLKLDREKNFNELYIKYKELIYCIAFSILKNRENSEDIVQIVFTKIYNMNIEKLPTENETSWLYTLTKNEALNYVRKQNNDLSIEDVDYIEYEDKELEHIIDRDSYDRIMKKLDSTEREIVSLKVLSNMKFKDISKLLNMPIGTVQWKYYTSLHSLKIILGNLSMFIIGVILFIANRSLKSNIQENYSGIDMSSEEVLNETEEEKEIENNESETNNSDNIVDSQSSVNQNNENQIMQNEIGQEAIEQNEIINGETSNENAESEVEQNEVDSEELEQEGIEQNFTDNSIIEHEIVQEESRERLNSIDIGILTFSFIFLITTIIFLINHIKYQLKRKKNVSK